MTTFSRPLPESGSLHQDIPGLWRGQQSGQAFATRATGRALLDQVLPHGGLPTGALTEILCDGNGLGELSLWWPLLQASAEHSPLVLIDPPYPPNAQAFAARGIKLQQLWWLRATRATEALWAAEQLLRAGCLELLLLWSSQVESKALRRLQLACEQGRCIGLVFRPEQYAAQASSAAVRWRLARASQNGELQLELLKCRGSSRAGQRFRWCPEQERLSAWSEPARGQLQPA